MSTESKILVTLCALVAIYAVCCGEWWIAASWTASASYALGMGMANWELANRK